MPARDAVPALGAAPSRPGNVCVCVWGGRYYPEPALGGIRTRVVFYEYAPDWSLAAKKEVTAQSRNQDVTRT